MQIFLKLFMKHFWIITDTDQSSRLFEPRARMPLEESPLDRQRSDITSDRRQVLYLYSNRMSQYFIMTSIIIVMALFCYSRCILVTLKIMNIVTDMFGYIWLFQVLRAFNWPELPGFDAWKSYCCIHNANCENRISWPSLTQINLPWGGVNRSLDIQCLRNRGACVIKRWLSSTCLSHVPYFG